MVLTKEQILAAADLQRELVEVPEWGGSVYVRGLTAAERVEYETKAYQHIKRHGIAPPTYQAHLVALGVVNENGERLFSDADAQALLAKSGAVVARLAKKVSELSGLTAEEQADARKN